MRTFHVIILAFLLTAIALGIFYYKYRWLEFPLTPDKTYNSWYIETKLDITGSRRNRSGENPAIIRLYIPKSTSQYAIVDESIVASGFGYEILRPDDTPNRQVIFTKRRIDRTETAYYRAIVYELDSPAKTSLSKKSGTPEIDSPYAPQNRAGRINDTEDPLLLAIDTETFIREAYKLVERGRRDDRMKIIQTGTGLRDNIPALLEIVVEANGIPARLAHGVQLSTEARNSNLQTWLEIYTHNKWKAVDPKTHRFGLQSDYLVWWYGPSSMFDAEGVRLVEPTISVRQNTDNALTRAIWKSGELANLLLKFSFFNLPLDTQLVFEVLLLIPIGGLIIAFLRQVIGIKTFGTFMPVLIALSFRETGLISGVTLFTLIVILGLIIRAYFNQLQLLLVPRLAAVLTVVVILLSL
jgi:transglutaminase-like putative cysteine protease